MNSVHKTVLLKETIDGLNLSDKSIVVDATFGGGGHSLEICKRYPKVKVIALDQDKSAFKKAKEKFKGIKCDISFINSNFRNLDEVIKEEVDGFIFDLGLSSDQLENSGRGFSFMKSEPLFMTMKENPSSEDLTALDVVNTWGEENLANIIYGFGEERLSRKIAKGIVDARKKKKIETTTELVEIISGSVPAKYRNGKIHFATKTFQAIRIAVNDELGALSAGLEKGFNVLKKGGRISVISFHSLEDRVVKKFFKEKAEKGEAKSIPARNEFHSGGNKKVILASVEEVKENPRARSAKLRILEKIKI